MLYSNLRTIIIKNQAPLTPVQCLAKNVALACLAGAGLAVLPVLTAHLSFQAAIWMTAGKFIPLQAAILLTFAPSVITAAKVAAIVGGIALAGFIISRLARL